MESATWWRRVAPWTAGRARSTCGQAVQTADTICEILSNEDLHASVSSRFMDDMLEDFQWLRSKGLKVKSPFPMAVFLNRENKYVLINTRENSTLGSVAIQDVYAQCRNPMQSNLTWPFIRQEHRVHTVYVDRMPRKVPSLYRHIACGWCWLYRWCLRCWFSARSLGFPGPNEPNAHSQINPLDVQI